jgi:ribosomal protein S18 acetylase RimI-like enzyme
MELSFQPISKLDLYQLRDIALKTFAQSYQHLNTKANFEWYIKRAFTVEKLLSELQNDISFFYFIMAKENIIGYLKLNIEDSQTEKHCEDSLEVERIYLDVNYKRKGIGSKMIQFVKDKAKQYSKSKIWLGVWEKNPSAILFYQNQGFVNSGSHIFKFGDEDQIDIIFEQSI